MARGRALLVMSATLGVACGGAQTHAQHETIAVAYRFHCTPSDARITVDEVDQGQCVLYETQYLGLGPGTHRLRVEREGYLPIERDLPSTGRRESLDLRLRALPE